MTKRQILVDMNFGRRVAEEEGERLSRYFVETDHWRRLFSDDVDIIYGPKGSGKSALYSLLIARSDALFDRKVILAAAENPRGAPAFRDLVADPPASEREFIALWKLYFLSLLGQVLSEYGISGEDGEKLLHMLQQEGLAPKGSTLATRLRSAFDYIKRVFRPSGVEGGVEIDPITGLPKGFSGKITFSEPSSAGTREGLVSVDALLGLADRALSSSGYSVWICLDRLDVAFTDSELLEQNALRALFHVYLDLLAHAHLRAKIFLRTDIWRRITASGFREASHITRHMTIEWNYPSLVHLMVSRIVQNEPVLELCGTTSADALKTTLTQDAFIYQILPDQVDVGPNKPRTTDWMLSRTRDATQQNAPRELIHLLDRVREVQIRKLEVGEAEPEGTLLFARTAFKEALPEVSRVRLEQTLYAEYPSFREHLEKLRGLKTQQNVPSLAAAWKVTSEEALSISESLVEVGFFERRGSREVPEFWVPFIYRDALDMVQGAAD